MASSRLVVQIPISFGKPSLRRRLEDYYSLIVPEIIANKEEWHAKFDLIYQKYGGTCEGEQKLSRSLAKKYGSTVQFMTARAIDDSIAANNSNLENDARMKTDQNALHTKPEAWFELTEQERNSGIIDFTSDRFDPVAALHSDIFLMAQSHNYIQNFPIFDNVAKARVLLPDFDPYRIDPVLLATKNAGRETKQASTNAAAVAEGSKVKAIPILTEIASQYQTGPLSLLYRCFVERKRVKVLVRYVDCIRGTLTGYIVGFDKHFNIILRDADEVYTPRNLNNHAPKALSSSSEGFKGINGRLLQSKVDMEVQRRKAVKRRRHCKQLLVRGDNVVMVWRTGDANLFAAASDTKSKPEKVPKF